MDHGLNGMNTYGLLKATRASETFKKASSTAAKWNTLWRYLSYSIDISSFCISIVLATNTKMDFIPKNTTTALLSVVASLKAIEVMGKFKDKAATSSIIKENYKTVSYKLEDALETLNVISKGGITDDEMHDWSKMMRFIEELIESTKKWPSPSVTSSMNVASAINDLQEIERGILKQQFILKGQQQKNPYHFASVLDTPSAVKVACSSFSKDKQSSDNDSTNVMDRETSSLSYASKASSHFNKSLKLPKPGILPQTILGPEITTEEDCKEEAINIILFDSTAK